MADKQEKVVSGAFEMVKVDRAEATNGSRGKYNRLVEDFAKSFEPGDCITLRHPDGKDLTDDEAKAIYAGVTQYLRYQRIKKNRNVPVKPHRNRQTGTLYLERLGE